MTAKNAAPGKHNDGQGLWLVKRDRTFGKWVLRLTVSGKRREMGLGPWPDVSIAEARERAAEARKTLRNLEDPIEARRKTKRAQKPLTVKQAIDSCFESKKAELKGDGAAGRWLSPLSIHVVPKIGQEPIEDLDQHMIRALLKPLWHTKPDTAEKALQRLNIALRHAAALGLDVDLQAPMKAKALLGKQRRTPNHIPSVPYVDAPAFYQSLVGKAGVSVLALRLLLLTLARTSEVRFATRPEFTGDLWTIPAARTKTGKEHVVPLTHEAQVVVRLAFDRSKNAYLFTGYTDEPMTDMAMAKYMSDCGYEARPHGFRATFRTWAEEQTDAAFEVKEACLGHTVDSKVVGAYQRSDRLAKRRSLLEQWSQFLLPR